MVSGKFNRTVINYKGINVIFILTNYGFRNVFKQEGIFKPTDTTMST